MKSDTSISIVCITVCAYALNVVGFMYNLLFSFLAKRGVKEEIMSFNARKISPEIRDSVQELLEKNKKSFDPAVSLTSHLLF